MINQCGVTLVFTALNKYLLDIKLLLPEFATFDL